MSKVFFYVVALLGLMGWGSCTNPNGYRVERKFKSLVDDERCSVSFFYPALKWDDGTTNRELDFILENCVEYEQYTRNCDAHTGAKNVIKGDFKVTFATKDLLSIEFTEDVLSYGGREKHQIYHSIVLNPELLKTGQIAAFERPEDLFPQFDRGRLYPFVSAYNGKHQRQINLRAYETGSNYALNWGISATDLILYVGGEGECYGEDRIFIPLDALGVRYPS